VNDQTRRNVGEVIASQLDAFQAEADRLAKPYAEAAELRRRIHIAEAYVGELPCTCGLVVVDGRAEPRCARHDLERILAGDE
jgi:hypothetical protein